MTALVGWVFDESPCESACPHIKRCRAAHEACKQFAVFVTYGGQQWRSASRKPSIEIYAKIYRETAAEAVMSRNEAGRVQAA